MAQIPINSYLLLFPERSRDWTQQELAEFYRVENALNQSGLHVSSERGLSDEGDPWFVFFRDNDHEPLVHFARIDGFYVIASAAYDGVARGKNFREMILDLLSRHRLNSEVISKKSNILFHPAALLITLVGVAFFKAPSAAKADDGGHTDNAPLKHRVSLVLNSKNSSPAAMNGDMRAASTAPVASEWNEESASILLSAIAGLMLPETAASTDELAQKIVNSNASSSDAFLQPASNAIAHQATATLKDAFLKTEIAIDENSDAIPLGAAMAAATSEAGPLLGLLNSVPISSQPNDPVSLSSLVKASAQLASTTQYTPITAHDNYGGALIYVQHVASETSKPNDYSLILSENAQKQVITTQIKVSSDEYHASELHTYTTISTTSTSPTQVPYVYDKTILDSSVTSAITIISRLDNSFHFTGLTPSSALSTAVSIAITNTTASPSQGALDAPVPQAPQSQQGSLDSPSLQASAAMSADHNYDMSVIGDTVTSSSSAGPTGSLEAASSSALSTQSMSSNSWSGSQISHLLEKFIQTFPKFTFIATESDNFVFRTEASQKVVDHLEQITINFQDGSHIDIIGQKAEIDGFMILS